MLYEVITLLGRIRVLWLAAEKRAGIVGSHICLCQSAGGRLLGCMAGKRNHQCSYPDLPQSHAGGDCHSYSAQRG